jgi:Zn-dependent peptidase ImmA (M78 family)
MNIEDIEELCAELCFRAGAWGIPTDLQRIVNYLGIRVITRRWAGLPHAASIMTPRIVFLNSARPMCSRRFDCSHEIFHFVAKDERETMNDEKGAGVLFRLGAINRPLQKQQRFHGDGANWFAAELLMPGEMMRKMLAAGRTADREMAREFGVSVSALMLREGEMRKSKIRNQKSGIQICA